MTTRQIPREVAGAVAREVSFTDETLPAWSNDFVTQGAGAVVFTRASSGGYYSSAGAWVNAGSDVARLDYNPATLQPRGLLVEEARTNYVLNSAAPATQTLALAVGTYTLWVSGTGSCTCAAGTAAGSGFGSANASTAVVFTVSTAGSVVFTVSGSLSRMQCENGAFATSFITTTGSAATRSADVCYAVLGSLLSAAEGTLAVACTVGQNGAIAAGLDNGSGGGPTRAHIGAKTTTRNLFINVTGVQKADINQTNTVAAGSPAKLAMTYGAAGSLLACNGVLVGTNSGVDSSGLAVTALRVGCRFFPGATGQLNGWVQKVAYYQKAMAAGPLVQITA